MKSKQTTLDNWQTPKASSIAITSTNTKSKKQSHHIIKTQQTTTIQNQLKPHSNNLAQATLFFDDTIHQDTKISCTIHPNFSKYDKWGHTIGQKLERSARIVLRNINTLPKEKNHNKNDILINEIITSQADVYCATEVNVAWQNIPEEDRVTERFKGKLEFAKFVTAYNKA